MGVFAGTTPAGAVRTTIVDFASGRASEQPSVAAGLVTAGGRAVQIRKVVAGSRKVVVPQKPTSTVQRCCSLFDVLSEDRVTGGGGGGHVVPSLSSCCPVASSEAQKESNEKEGGGCKK